LLDRPQIGLDVEGVHGDFLVDAWHFYRAPHKYVLIASEDVNEPAFLFWVQTGPDLHGFGRVSGIDLHGLSVLGRFESAGHRGHGRVEWCRGYSEAEFP
jgi:hypothetical protein